MIRYFYFDTIFTTSSYLEPHFYLIFMSFSLTSSTLGNLLINSYNIHYFTIILDHLILLHCCLFAKTIANLSILNNYATDFINFDWIIFLKKEYYKYFFYFNWIYFTVITGTIEILCHYCFLVWIFSLKLDCFDLNHYFEIGFRCSIVVFIGFLLRLPSVFRFID